MTLGGQRILRVLIGADLEHLERHLALAFGILCQVHVGHAAAAQLAQNLELADLR